MSLLLKSFFGGTEFEWPQEVVSLLEVGSTSDNFVNQILNTQNSYLSEFLLNDVVVGQRNSASADFSVPSLIDELSDGLTSWVPIGNIGFNFSHHVDSSFVQSYECTIVELSESEQLQNLFAGWVQLVDTIIRCVKIYQY